MNKSKDPVNYILTGSRYQVTSAKGEMVPEYGVGTFRSGIYLTLAMNLYVEMAAGKEFEGPLDAGQKALARRLAASAFGLTEAFLDELDKNFLRTFPPPPSPIGDNNSDRK